MPATDLSDPAQLSHAFDEHHRSVFAVAMRVVGDHALAGDVVQDVFLRLWRRPGAFDPQRGDLGTYLRLMARSRALDLLREGQVRSRAADRFKVLESTGAGAVWSDDLGEEGAEVREALRDLPHPQREALVLAYWGGMTAEEIAQSKHIPLGTAKSRIRLGLTKLRAELEPVAVAA